MTLRPDPSAFRRRLATGEKLVGTFIKTPTGHSVEIFGALAYDFVVLDEEHGPFHRGAIDQAVVAARAAGIAALVRVASAAPSNLMAVLDCGATGVLVPHVAGVETARAVAAACRYRGGTRGFSNSPRAGDYGGLGMWEHVDRCDAITTVVAQIEDPQALDHVDAIARVDGIDALFIGRGDLAVALGAKGSDAPEVADAAARIAAAGKAAGKPVMVFTGGAADAKAMRALGASAFVVSSDQGLMRQAAKRALADLAAID